MVLCRDRRRNRHYTHVQIPTNVALCSTSIDKLHNKVVSEVGTASLLESHHWRLAPAVTLAPSPGNAASTCFFTLPTAKPLRSTTHCNHLVSVTVEHNFANFVK